MTTKRFFSLLLLLLGGCSFTAPDAAIEAIHKDVKERSGVSPDWEVEKRGAEEIEKLLGEKLSGEMSIDDAVAVSLLNNRKLSALYQQLGVARSDLVAARLPENPVFSAERRFKGKATEFDVAQEFLSIFLVPLRVRIAESQFDQERLRLTQEILEHTAHVRSAYYSVQAGQQLLEMRRSVVAATDAAYQAAINMNKAGNNTALEVSQELRGANHARLELAEAELSLAENREHLNVLLGLWGEGTAWRVPARLPDLPESELPPDELEKKAISERFDLASLRSEIVGLAQSMGLANVMSYIPGLEIGAHSEREPEGDTSRGPSISFPVPIFNFGQAARARAKYLLLEAQDRYATLAVEIRSEVRMAYMRMDLARKKVAFYQLDVLPVQQTITQQTQLRYNGMFLGVFELLEAKQAQIDAGRDYIEAVKDYWITRSELEKVLGRRLPRGGEVAQEVTSPAIPSGPPTVSAPAHRHGM